MDVCMYARLVNGDRFVYYFNDFSSPLEPSHRKIVRPLQFCDYKTQHTPIATVIIIVIIVSGENTRASKQKQHSTISAQCTVVLL